MFGKQKTELVHKNKTVEPFVQHHITPRSKYNFCRRQWILVNMICDIVVILSIKTLL